MLDSIALLNSCAAKPNVDETVETLRDAEPFPIKEKSVFSGEEDLRSLMCEKLTHKKNEMELFVRIRARIHSRL